jgi:hypothetical protein
LVQLAIAYRYAVKDHPNMQKARGACLPHNQLTPWNILST